jgi:magnesium chelatase family protein
VLFLDELPEFERRSLESLRQIAEARQVVIARARMSCVFPADFQLVAAANRCPCGWRGSPIRDCRCDEGAVGRYASRVSGALLDRIDLHVAVEAVSWQELSAPQPGTSSELVRRGVAAARRIQERRGARRGCRTNARIDDAGLDEAVAASPEALALLGRAVDRLGLSARAARRVLKVARTIADLAGDAETGPEAVAEALGYRDDSPRGM